MNVRQMKLAALAACFSTFCSTAGAGEFSVSADAEGTRGDYGTGLDSTVSSLTLGLQYQGDRFGWWISAPWLVVQAPADVVVSGGMVQFGGRRAAGTGPGGGMGPGGGAGTGSASSSTATATRTESGFGDLAAGAGVTVLQESDTAPFLGFSAKVKVGTADESRGLGTGANDYAVQVEAAKGWLNGRAGYRWIGNNDATDFNNVAYGAVGITYGYPSGGDTGVEYFTEQAIDALSDPRRELTLYGSVPLGETTRLRGYLVKGFSDASPDLGGGIGIVVGL